MANEKWFRIVWNDELWRSDRSGTSDRNNTGMNESTPNEMRVVHQGVYDGEGVDVESSSGVASAPVIRVEGDIAEVPLSSSGVESEHGGGTLLGSRAENNSLNQNVTGTPDRRDEIGVSPVPMGQRTEVTDDAVGGGANRPDGSSDAMARLDFGAVPDAPIQRAVPTDRFMSAETLLEPAVFGHVQRPVGLASIGSVASVSRSRTLRSSESGSVPNRNDVPQAYDLADTSNSSALEQTVRQVVNDQLAQLRVYVLESDITEAQQAVKTVVKQASF